ncbi:MAG: hypothetical protein IH969_03805 [Candidatus Krumholzibacteriota bacterium]|nr:hypothetical protein [Candidatus Krumholzibacteriota bacterium]
MPNHRFVRHFFFFLLAAAFVGLTAFSAYAQSVPRVQWFFDADFTQTDKDCDGSLNNIGYVVAVNFNAFISAVEYRIDYPPRDFSWEFDLVVNENQFFIGSTPFGIASAWSLPLDCFQPTVIMQVLYDWSGCNNCNPAANTNQPIVAGPNPSSGRLRFVRFPDNAEFDAIGMLSLVCPGTIPVEETTWGQVKALYR